MRIEHATHEDFLEILRNVADFWSSSGPPTRTLPYHYPFLVHEFADTAFVVRADEVVIAYLFGRLHPPARGHGAVQHRLAEVPRRDGLRGDRAVADAGGTADLPQLSRSGRGRDHLLQAAH
jgi:hypothetical protein